MEPPIHPKIPKAKMEYRVGKKQARYSLTEKAKIVEYIEEGVKTS